VVTLTSDLFATTGEIPVQIPVTVDQADGGRCAAVDFLLTGLLPDTGQTFCCDNSSVITCPAEGEDFWGQDAQFGWDLYVTPAERYERTEPVASEPVVFDKITQLMWQGCAAGLTGAGCVDGDAESYNWYEATGTPDDTYNPGGAVDYCGDLDWGGYTDWRLPTVRELSWIVNAGQYYPSIDGTAFPGTPSSWFWSSSSYATDSYYAWLVDFDYGYVHNSDKNHAYRARCVRGSVGPQDLVAFEPLILFGDRVVRDTDTGLTWQGCAAGLSGADCGTGSASWMTWQAALAYCEDLTWGGYDDWRLPDRNELQGIADYDVYGPSIDETVFPGTPSSYFLSSSSYAYLSYRAWHVDFGNGAVNSDHLKYNPNHARCVRGRVGP